MTPLQSPVETRATARLYKRVGLRQGAGALECGDGTLENRQRGGRVPGLEQPEPLVVEGGTVPVGAATGVRLVLAAGGVAGCASTVTVRTCGSPATVAVLTTVVGGRESLVSADDRGENDAEQRQRTECGSDADRPARPSRRMPRARRGDGGGRGRRGGADHPDRRAGAVGERSLEIRDQLAAGSIALRRDPSRARARARRRSPAAANGRSSSPRGSAPLRAPRPRQRRSRRGTACGRRAARTRRRQGRSGRLRRLPCRRRPARATCSRRCRGSCPRSSARRRRRSGRSRNRSRAPRRRRRASGSRA